MGSPQQPLQPAPSRGIRRTDSAHERGHVAGRVTSVIVRPEDVGEQNTSVIDLDRDVPVYSHAVLDDGQDLSHSLSRSVLLIEFLLMRSQTPISHAQSGASQPGDMSTATGRRRLPIVQLDARWSGLRPHGSKIRAVAASVVDHHFRTDPDTSEQVWRC